MTTNAQQRTKNNNKTYYKSHIKNEVDLPLQSHQHANDSESLSTETCSVAASLGQHASLTASSGANDYEPGM